MDLPKIRYKNVKYFDLVDARKPKFPGCEAWAKLGNVALMNYRHNGHNFYHNSFTKTVNFVFQFPRSEYLRYVKPTLCG